MILGIVGSRFYDKYSFVKKAILDTIDITQVTEIVSGGAPGVDTIARAISNFYDIKFTEKKAKWNREDGSQDLSAGMKRNIEIINVSDVMIAFWDGRKEHCGTYNDIQYCKAHDKICHVIEVDVKETK